MRIFRPAAGVFLFLALMLGTSTGFAAPARATAPAARQGAAERGSLLLQLRDFLLSLWSPAGCEMDPWGRCLQGARTAVPRPPAPEAGCQIDPLGRCNTQP
jgi:hypothetical protein